MALQHTTINGTNYSYGINDPGKTLSLDKPFSAVISYKDLSKVEVFHNEDEDSEAVKKFREDVQPLLRHVLGITNS